MERKPNGASGKPSLQHVAKEAKVSITTASLALSGKGKISQAVRERVALAATRIGYSRRHSRPEEGADTPQTFMVLLPVDDMWAHIFYFVRPIIVEIERTLINEGFYPAILPTFYSTDVEKTIRKILANEAKAVFSIHYGSKSMFEQLEGMGIPVVVIMNNNFQDTFHSICVDDFQGSYEGCLHLIRLGHRRIGYVEYPRPDLPAIVADRFIGFRKAMDEYRLTLDNELRLTVGQSDRAALGAGLRTMFSRSPRPTALFVHDDYFAARVIAELGTMGLRVPGDVSIVAPGDVLDYDDPFVPQITTMRIDTALMGKLAAEMILSRIKQKSDDIHVLKVKQQLVDRGSCSPPT